MGRKKKRMRGVPVIYDEAKEPRNFSLTPTASALIDKKAKEMGISRSELIEKFARNTLNETNKLD